MKVKLLNTTCSFGRSPLTSAFHSLLQSQLPFHYMLLYVILLVTVWAACRWSNVNSIWGTGWGNDVITARFKFHYYAVNSLPPIVNSILYSAVNNTTNSTGTVRFTTKHYNVWGETSCVFSGKRKAIRNRTGEAQRVQGDLVSQISMTFGTWRWWGCHHHAPAAFFPQNFPGTYFH